MILVSLSITVPLVLVNPAKKNPMKVLDDSTVIKPPSSIRPLFVAVWKRTKSDKVARSGGMACLSRRSGDMISPSLCLFLTKFLHLGKYISVCWYYEKCNIIHIS